MKRILPFILVLVSFLWISGTIDLNNLFNYSAQNTPNYIIKDNTQTNTISDEGATLGRVLFYDKSLSKDNSIACASCHIQEFAFGDTAQASQGVNGTTGRHSMRLINARFANETRFFWDERAATLEEQTSMPIQDHTEMGFSGTNGDPDIDSLIRKLSQLPYYKSLFSVTFGDTNISEERIQNSLAQFIRSIESFDSKFDSGLLATNNFNPPFPNYTTQENLGKNLFLAPPQFDTNSNRIGGGAGCAGCHQPPEFDIDPVVGNNGVLNSIGGGIDFTNTRSPSLRDIFNTNGVLNGPLMHNGGFNSLVTVINHYDSIPNVPPNSNLDPRLRPGGKLQRLHLTLQERNSLVAFVKTLSGMNVYTDEKWSNPFDENGNISIIDLTTSIEVLSISEEIMVYPNPCSNWISISGNYQDYRISVLDIHGKTVIPDHYLSGENRLDLDQLAEGVYFIKGTNTVTNDQWIRKIVKIQ